VGVVQVVQRYKATCGADGEVGRLVDESADLDQVKEDGEIDWAGTRGEAVDLDESLQDVVGELQPWPMKRRNIAPVPAFSIDQQLSLALRRKGLGRRDAHARTMRCQGDCDGKARGVGTTNLLRQMIRAGDGGAWGSAGATGLDLELEPALVLVLLGAAAAVVVVVVMPTSFLEAGPAPSGTSSSFFCLFFFLVIFKSD
jgi:DNA-binding transcriptional LysR family regulator